MRSVFLVVAFAGLQFANPAQAQPSFDCAKAATQTEIAICKSPVLSQLDRQMSDAYAKARADVFDREKRKIRQAQIDWIGQRDLCGSDAPCLEAAMRQRIGQLGMATASQIAPTGLTGAYCARGGSDTILVEDDGDALKFSFSSFQASGHSCGTGRIRAVKSGAAFLAQDHGCTFHITINDGTLVFSTGEETACREFCGARAQFGQHIFDLETRHPLQPDWTTAMESGDC